MGLKISLVCLVLPVQEGVLDVLLARLVPVYDVALVLPGLVGGLSAISTTALKVEVGLGHA